MKFPWFQFYPGDWLKDPSLSMCSPSTRGIWIDALAAMHESDRCGHLTGTPAQLARLLRCSPSDVQVAFKELKHTRAADVREDSHGCVTIINRRMKREYEDRVSARNRKRKERGVVSVTEDIGDLSAPCHDAVTTLSATESEVRSQKSDTETKYKEEKKEEKESQQAGSPPPKPNKEKGSLEEFKAYAIELGLPETDGSFFHDSMESNGWKTGKNPVKDWRAALRKWKLGGWLPSQKQILIPFQNGNSITRNGNHTSSYPKRVATANAHNSNRDYDTSALPG